MQSPRVRASSPRPLTRRSSKRETSSSPSKSSKSASSFHLPPVSPTTPVNPFSAFANSHSSISSSLPPLTTQLSTPPPSRTPPPTPASSPTASRPTRHLSFRRKQSDLIRMTSDLPRRQSDLTRRSSDLTRRESDLTRKQSDLTRKQSGLARKQSSLTRRQSRRQGQSQSPDASLTTPAPESPRKVRFGGESVEYLAGDSSDEDDGFFADPELESRPTVNAPRPKDLGDSRRRAREILEHDNLSGLITESDNDASRRGRSSNRGAQGKRSVTPFVRRGSNLDEDDEEGGNHAEENYARHGTRSDTDESFLRKRTSSIDRDDASTSGRGRSSSRGVPPKRSSTPFVRRSVSWEDEDDQEHDKDGSEKNDSVIVHASSEERSNDDGAIRRGRSIEDNGDEPSMSTRGRSSSRGSPSKRSATPFARRNVNWEDEDEEEEDNRNEAEPESANRNDNNAQCSPQDGNGEDNGVSHVRRGRGVNENDDEPLSSRGRSSSRGTRTKRSATPFVKRDIYWADEDEDDADENDAQSVRANRKEHGIVQTNNSMLPMRRSVEKVERVCLPVIQEIEECVTILEDEDESSVGQQRIDAVRNNSTDTTERQKENHHQGTILENGDLQVIVACNCGLAQILSYSPLTGIDIRPR